MIKSGIFRALATAIFPQAPFGCQYFHHNLPEAAENPPPTAACVLRGKESLTIGNQENGRS
jgi:hypothetical protein